MSFLWRSWLARLLYTQKVPGSSPGGNTADQKFCPDATRTGASPPLSALCAQACSCSQLMVPPGITRIVRQCVAADDGWIRTFLCAMCGAGARRFKQVHMVMIYKSRSTIGGGKHSARCTHCTTGVCLLQTATSATPHDHTMRQSHHVVTCGAHQHTHQ